MEQERLKEEVRQLEIIIDSGRSAERLQANSDWQKMSEEILKHLEMRERSRNEVISNLVDLAITRDQRDDCMENIRRLNQEIRDFRFLLARPGKSIQAAAIARKRLEQIKAEGGYHG